jgi:hypothetical protein
VPDTIGFGHAKRARRVELDAPRGLGYLWEKWERAQQEDDDGHLSPNTSFHAAGAPDIAVPRHRLVSCCSAQVKDDRAGTAIPGKAQGMSARGINAWGTLGNFHAGDGYVFAAMQHNRARGPRAIQACMAASIQCFERNWRTPVGTRHAGGDQHGPDAEPAPSQACAQRSGQRRSCARA